MTLADYYRRGAIAVAQVLGGFDEAAIIRDVCEYAKFYLRIIRDDELSPFGRAEASAKVEGVRDLLDVGIGATHSSGRRADLVEV